MSDRRDGRQLEREKAQKSVERASQGSRERVHGSRNGMWAMVSGFQVKEVEVENANVWGRLEKKPEHMRIHMKEAHMVLLNPLMGRP